MIQESSAIGNYPDSFEKPGSSFLWIGASHHFNREEVRELIGHMQRWLDTGNIETTTPLLQWTETEQGRCFFADSAYKPVVDGEPKDLIWQLDLSTDDDSAWVVFESSPELLDGAVDVFRPGAMEWKSIEEAKAYCQGRESLLLAEAGK